MAIVTSEHSLRVMILRELTALGRDFEHIRIGNIQRLPKDTAGTNWHVDFFNGAGQPIADQRLTQLIAIRHHLQSKYDLEDSA